MTVVTAGGGYNPVPVEGVEEFFNEPDPGAADYVAELNRMRERIWRREEFRGEKQEELIKLENMLSDGVRSHGADSKYCSELRNVDIPCCRAAGKAAESQLPRLKRDLARREAQVDFRSVHIAGGC